MIEIWKWLGFLILHAHASLVYSPPKLNPSTGDLVVVIHGCLQSAESMALGTGWDQIAEAKNFVVMYPQVPASSNPIDCWNWYSPENQRSDIGQLRVLRDEIMRTKNLFKLAKGRVFVTGISSGAATVAGLLACFPKDFTAGALHSGPSYGLAQSLPEGEKVLKEGPGTGTTKLPCRPSDFTGRILVLQGTSDSVVNPKNASRVLSDFLPNAKQTKSIETTDGGLKFSTSDFSENSKVRGRLVLIDGLDHSWSGFTKNLRHGELLGPSGKIPTRLPFFSDKGPSATNLIWDFFSNKP